MNIEIGAQNSPFGKDFYLIDLPGCPFKCNEYRDVMRYGFTQANASVDFIVMIHVLEHCPQEKLHYFLTEVYRVLKPSGKFRVHVPNFASIAASYMADPKILPNITALLLGGDDRDTHRIAFDHTYLNAEIAKAGFKSIRTLDESDRHIVYWKPHVPAASLIVEATK